LRRVLDEGTPDAMSGVVGVDADLLDVGRSVDDLEEEIGDWPIGGDDGDERPAAISTSSARVISRRSSATGAGVSWRPSLYGGRPARPPPDDVLVRPRHMVAAATINAPL
jgi:hypothetical protein